MDTSSITSNTGNKSCAGSLQFSSDKFSTCIKVSSSPTISNSQKSFTLDPSDNLSHYTSYKVRVSNDAKDSSGNNFGSQYDSSNFTTVNTEISVVVISPLERKDWALYGTDNETYIKIQFSKLNEVWPDQEIGATLSYAGFKTVDFSSYF